MYYHEDKNYMVEVEYPIEGPESYMKIRIKDKPGQMPPYQEDVVKISEEKTATTFRTSRYLFADKKEALDWLESFKKLSKNVVSVTDETEKSEQNPLLANNKTIKLDKKQVAEIDKDLAKSMEDWEEYTLYAQDGKYHLFYEIADDIGTEIELKDKEKVEAFLTEYLKEHDEMTSEEEMPF